jgi:hypothetical protein
MAAPAAGWYADPMDAAAWRWWDGGTWTGHVRPKVETAPVVVAPPVVPAPPVQPLSMTPVTPPSEQEYWHSPNAEIVEIPGRAATAHESHVPSGSTGAGYAVRVWGDVGSPQTAGIWLLAATPLLALALQLVVGVAAGVTQGLTGQTIGVPNVVFSTVVLVASWVFAGLDRKTLRERGYAPASIWWMLLLPPLIYFIARGKVVRREGQRAWPPELLYFASVVGIGALAVLAVVATLSMLNASGMLIP